MASFWSRQATIKSQRDVSAIRGLLDRVFWEIFQHVGPILCGLWKIHQQLQIPTIQERLNETRYHRKLQMPNLALQGKILALRRAMHSLLILGRPGQSVGLQLNYQPCCQIKTANGPKLSGKGKSIGHFDTFCLLGKWLIENFITKYSPNTSCVRCSGLPCAHSMWKPRLEERESHNGQVFSQLLSQSSC